MTKDIDTGEGYFVCTLPNETVNLFSYINHNKISLLECVVDSIQYAKKNKLKNIQVFKFHKSKFVIILTKDSFLGNINMIYNFYLENELYEKCPRVIKLKKELEKWK